MILDHANHPGGVSKSIVLKASRLPVRQFNRILNEMAKAGRIRMSCEYRSVTKPTIVIYASTRRRRPIRIIPGIVRMNSGNDLA